MQIVDFDIDRPNIRFELADQIERPFLERRVGIRALNSMRIYTRAKFSKAPSRLTCRSCNPQNSSWSST
jgi:hypothetical protein